jgi:hypothetical protein
MATKTVKKTWTPTKAAVAVPVYCGSCVHFDTLAIRTSPEGHPTTCSGLNVGIVAKSKTCKDFAINAFDASLREAASNGNVSRLLAAMPPAALAPLAALMASEIDTRAAGFHFGQKVYVNVRYHGSSQAGHDTDFIANYYLGEVVMITPDGMAYVSHKKVRIAISVGALLTQEQWQVRKGYLLANNRIVDPTNPHSWARRDVKSLRDPNKRPAWLDSAIAAYLSRPIDDMTPLVPIRRKRGRPRRAPTTT